MDTARRKPRRLRHFIRCRETLTEPSTGSSHRPSHRWNTGLCNAQPERRGFGTDLRRRALKSIEPYSPQFAPIGVPGELYIGGEGVALGYLNSPELTVERFVADPFRSSPGGRLYKTGDLVRWRPDGNLDFLGRIDDQVKIRGFRIEPGEIEAVLERHPSVRRAVVKMWESEAGEKWLVGYYESNTHSSAEPAALLEFLGSQLPRYMVPVSLIKVEKLPLTASGKVDRLGLPKPERHVGETYSGAQLTATEQIVSNVFANVLRADDIDIRKSFFELGGDSLLAIRVDHSATRNSSHRDPCYGALQ